MIITLYLVPQSSHIWHAVMNDTYNVYIYTCQRKTVITCVSLLQVGLYLKYASL